MKNRRMWAILALILFFGGLTVFAVSLIRHDNSLAPYAFLLCAPGAVLAFLESRARKAEWEEKEEEKTDV